MISSSAEKNARDIIRVIDGDTNKIVGSIRLEFGTNGADSVALAVNSTTNRVYIVNRAFGKITVLDGSTNQIIGDISVKDAARIAINPETNRIYVAADPRNGIVSVIDGSTNQVVEAVDVGIGILVPGVNVNTTTNLIYVSVLDTVEVIDGSTNKIIDTVNVFDSQGSAIAVNSISNRVYVTHPVPNIVSVIDEAIKPSAVSSISMGDSPRKVAVNPSTNRWRYRSKDRRFYSK